MANEFGGPSAQSSFLTGLAGSIAHSIKEDYDQRHKEDEDKKAFDYQLLVKAMNDPDITPSQARELLTRAVDIYKPKGHGGVKENLKQIFGGQPGYTPQAGNIINDVTSKPKLNVQTPTQTATPGGIGAEQVRPRTVTLPPPPQSKPELTYREQAMEDEATKQQLILQRQLALEDEHEKHRQDDIKLRTNEAIRRVEATLPQQEKWRAGRKLSEKAYVIAAGTGRSVDDPQVVKQAADELEHEVQMRKETHQAQMEYFKQRNEKMKADIQATNERIEIARQHLNVTKQNKFKELPQVKQADVEINRLMNESQSTRIRASQALGNYAETGDAQWQRNAEELTAEAEKYEKEARDKAAFKESYLQWYEGGGANPNGVKVPDAPKRGGGTGRSGTKLTVSEATAGLKQLHPDWDDARVNAAIEAEKAKPNSRIAQ